MRISYFILLFFFSIVSFAQETRQWEAIAAMSDDNLTAKITEDFHELRNAGEELSTSSFVVDFLSSDNEVLTTALLINSKKPILSITCPGNRIVNNDMGTCAAIVAGIGPTMTTDDFGIDSISFVLTGATTGNGLNDASGIAFNVGVTTVTYTITEIGGNTSNCSFSVTVNDTEDPVIVGPFSSTRDNDIGICGAVINGIGPVIMTDNCGIDSVSYVLTGATTGNGLNDASGLTFGLGTTTVTYTIADLSGNTDTYVFLAVVLDGEAPSVTCPNDIAVNNDAGVCGAVVNGIGILSQTDNCLLGGITYELTGVTTGSGLTDASGTFFNLGITTVSYILSDNAGNLDTCSFNVTVLDNEVPVFNCPSNRIEYVDASCDFTIPDYTGTITGLSDCISTGLIALTQSPVIGSTVSNHGAVQPIVIYATDTSGNVDSCSFTITLLDTIDPFILGPSNSTRNNDPGICGAVVNGIGPVTVTDNCLIDSISYVLTGATTGSGLNDASGLVFGLGITTVTYTVTDFGGNTDTYVFIAVVLDGEAPSITCPNDVTVNNDAGVCGAIVNGIGTLLETDNCILGGTTYELTGATTGSGLTDASGTFFNLGVTTVTYILSDNAGNQDTCSFNVTVLDNEAPVFNCPSNRNEYVDTSCDFTIPDYTGTITGLNDCISAGLITVTQSPTIGTIISSHGTVQPIVIYAADTSGNIDSCSFTITLLDTILPFILCPPNSTRNNDPGICGAVVNGIAPATTTDNCLIDSVSYILTGATTGNGLNDASGLTFNVGLTTVSYLVTDIAGLTSTCSFTVTVNDTEIPNVTTPVNITVNNAPGLCGRTVFGISPVMFNDNCGIGVISYTLTGATTGSGLNTADGTFFNVGITTLTYTINDLSGNSNSYSFLITIVDNESPSISCPANVSVNNDIGLCSAVVNGIAPLSFNDNCFIDSVSYILTGATIGNGLNDASGLTFNVGITTVTYTVTDISGNINSCNFTVTVVDNEVPVFSCPPNKNEFVDAGCGFSIPDYTLTAVGLMDNCTSSGLITLNQLPTVGTVISGHGTTQAITIYASDAFGNIDSCSFNITLIDTIPPSITCLPDVTLNNVLGSCGRQVTGIPPTIIENCTIDSVSYVLTGATIGNGLNDASGIAFNVGVTTVTYIAVDVANNSDTCTFTVTINDTEPPVITCPANVILNNDVGVCGALLLTGIAPTSFSDNCGIDSVNYVLTGATSGNGLDSVSGTFFNVGVTTVTYTITDLSSNFVSCSFTVTVNDNELPTFICGLDRIEHVDTMCQFSIPDYSNTLTALSDNCTPPGLLTITQVPTIGTIISGHNTTQTITLSVMDTNNNTSSCSFLVTLLDTIKPVFICPGDRTEYLDSNCMYSIGDFANVTDNCTFPLNVTQTPAIGTLFTAETNITVKLVTDDGNGNSDSCSFLLFIRDTLAPVIICPNDTIVFASSINCDANLTLAPPFVADNCTGISVLNFMQVLGTDTITGINNASGTFLGGITTITWTAIDNSIKFTESVCSHIVTVLDTTAPVITCPANITVSTDNGICGAVVNYSDPIAVDNCPNNISVVQIAGLSDGALFPIGSTLNTFVATNDAGLTDTCSFTVLVNDTEAPTITCPDNIVVCDNTSISIPIPVVSDNCSVATVTNDFNGTNDASGTYPLGITTVNWTVSDGVNTSTCSMTVEVGELSNTADAGLDQLVLINQNTNFEANLPVSGVGVWSLISGTGTIDDVNDPLSLISNLTTGENIFRWTISNPPCPDSFDEVSIFVDGVEIPSGFSPNGDGNNDFFIIPNIETMNNEVAIFNRWGIEVFSAINYQNDWDGTSKDGKELPDDTYFYLVKLLEFDKEFNGFVVLKR